MEASNKANMNEDALIDERNAALRSARRWKRIARLLLRRYKGRLASAEVRADTLKEAMACMHSELAAALGDHTIFVENEEEPAPYVGPTRGQGN